MDIRDKCTIMAVVGMTALLMFMGVLFVNTDFSEHKYYSTSAVVVGLEDDNTVVVEDPTGNLWAFSLPDISRYYYGRIVTIVMNDMGTSKINDDMVVWVD